MILSYEIYTEDDIVQSKRKTADGIYKKQMWVRIGWALLSGERRKKQSSATHDSFDIGCEQFVKQ